MSMDIRLQQALVFGVDFIFLLQQYSSFQSVNIMIFLSLKMNAWLFLLDFVCFIRLWSTLAVIATIIAACFCGIIIGLDAKAVQDGRDRFGSLPRKSQVLAAQLAFAIVEMILCIVFIVIYIFVAIVVHYRLRRLHRGLHR